MVEDNHSPLLSPFLNFQIGYKSYSIDKNQKQTKFCQTWPITYGTAIEKIVFLQSINIILGEENKN